MKTQYYTAASLDGFIATEDDSLEWLFSLGDVNETSYPGFIAEVEALAMGSATYEWLLRHVVRPGAAGAPWPYAQPAWVFTTRRLEPVPGAAVCFVRGDVRPVHAEMTLGAGKPLLPRRLTGTAALRLTAVQRFGPGFAELRYDVPARD